GLRDRPRARLLSRRGGDPRAQGLPDDRGDTRAGGPRERVPAPAGRAAARERHPRQKAARRVAAARHPQRRGRAEAGGSGHTGGPGSLHHGRPPQPAPALRDPGRIAMTMKRVVVEIGMGTDIRGTDYTKAAVRALRDAQWHNSLSVAAALGKPTDSMVVEV